MIFLDYLRLDDDLVVVDLWYVFWMELETASSDVVSACPFPTPPIIRPSLLYSFFVVVVVPLEFFCAR